MFSQGVGQWKGAAEVYDADGRFAGLGREARSVQADDGAGQVTVEVSFEGPFSLSGSYTIADQGSFRTYEGPLNIGFAEALGEGLIAAHNYWPDLGLSQRFFLMVLPGGTRQLSLALLSRGERLRWTVVGEYQRQVGESSAAQPPAAAHGKAHSGHCDPPLTQPPAVEQAQVGSRDDPASGRGEPKPVAPADVVADDPASGPGKPRPMAPADVVADDPASGPGKPRPMAPADVVADDPASGPGKPNPVAPADVVADDPAVGRGEPNPVAPADVVADDPAVGRGELLLLRPGRWVGELRHLDRHLEPSGVLDYAETVAHKSMEAEIAPGIPVADHAGTVAHRSMEAEIARGIPVVDHAETVAHNIGHLEVELAGLGFAADVSFELSSDGREVWTSADAVAGSAGICGGRALSGQFHHRAERVRVWRREVVSLDGTTKAVLHIWYRGEQRLGATYGTLTFEPA